jgi:hypothetical protein
MAVRATKQMVCRQVARAEGRGSHTLKLPGRRGGQTVDAKGHRGAATETRVRLVCHSHLIVPHRTPAPCASRCT